MTPSAFESLRLVAIVAAVLLKLALMPVYFQSYLNLANQRLERQKKEAGRISNKELQKKVNDLTVIIVIYDYNTFFNDQNKCFTDSSSILLSLCCCIAIHCSINYLFILYIDV